VSTRRGWLWRCRRIKRASDIQISNHSASLCQTRDNMRRGHTAVPQKDWSMADAQATGTQAVVRNIRIRPMGGLSRARTERADALFATLCRTLAGKMGVILHTLPEETVTWAWVARLSFRSVHHAGDRARPDMVVNLARVRRAAVHGVGASLQWIEVICRKFFVQRKILEQKNELCVGTNSTGPF